MGNLGNFFPLDLKKKEIEQRLVPGAVLYLQMKFPEKTKDKYLVLVGSSEPDILTFIVNSETNDFIRQRPELNACQVTLDQKNHTFLEYDSKIACHEVHRLKRTDIEAALLADMERFQGVISDEVRIQIISAVVKTNTLSPIVTKNITKSLSI